MAIKALQKSVKKESSKVVKPKAKEEKVTKFISKGGTLAENFSLEEGDQRFTLRIPKWLMQRVDKKRKERVGKISRNLWILETIEKASRK